MFGWGRKSDAVLTVLRAENSDLRQTLRDEREAWAKERQTLVDRIVALANPAILRELRRVESAPRPATPAAASTLEWRPNFPGMDQAYKDPPSREDGDRILDNLVKDLRAERGKRQ
jgi:hypothetical protein